MVCLHVLGVRAYVHAHASDRLDCGHESESEQLEDCSQHRGFQ